MAMQESVALATFVTNERAATFITQEQAREMLPGMVREMRSAFESQQAQIKQVEARPC